MQPILGKNLCTILFSDSGVTAEDKIILMKAAVALWEEAAGDIENTMPYGLLPIWEMIEQEQRAIKAKASATAEKRKAGANARWSKSENMRAYASMSEHMQAMPKRKEEEERKLNKKKDLSSEEEGKNKKEEEEFPSGSSPSVDFSITKQGYRYRELAGLKVFEDPVEHALAVTGEPDTEMSRRCYGAYLRDIGKEAFLDVLRTFEAEIRAGEVPKNLGAALNFRLNSFKK